MTALAPKLDEDILLALRFLYYVKAKPVVPDHRYDEAEKEFIDRPNVMDTPLMNPGSDNESDYPPHIRSLGFYLLHVGLESGRPSELPKLKPGENQGALF